MSFLEFTEVHQWLDQMFLAHQTALFSLNVTAAHTRLKEYERNLCLHIDDEDNLLIPIYDARTSDVPGGAVELFTGEHEKIKHFLAEFHDLLNGLPALRELPLKHGIIKLFDRETIYKGLLEHHHAREQNILFPWLDKVTSIEEKQTLLEQCASLTAFKTSQTSESGG